MRKVSEGPGDGENRAKSGHSVAASHQAVHGAVLAGPGVAEVQVSNEPKEESKLEGK